jgi:hypothetical protein
MSLRVMVLVLALGCGGSNGKTANEPQNAKEKQLAEARAKGEIDKPGKKWGKWRYGGERDDCRYVVAGGKCFKTENKACQAARCRQPKKCTSVGGGPATVSCK